MKVVVAPTAFKGTSSPREAAEEIARGWRRRRPGDDLVVVPMADGGDGTAEVLAEALGGGRVERGVRGPRGGEVTAEAYLLPGGDAALNMASACGLVLVPEADRDPLRSDTRGVGDLAAACLDAGARRVLVGVGGSATTDGGAGMAAALGARFLSASGSALEPHPLAIQDLHSVDLSRLREGARRTVGLVDVRNPLLGSRGAAAVYGPQKGADAAAVDVLESVLTRLVAAVDGERFAARPGAGAAGGLGFGILALLGGRVVGGGEFVADAIGLDAAVRDAELVVTGEGRLDAQTAYGKAPDVVARHAAKAGVPCLAVVGECALDERGLRSLGIGDVAEAAGGSIADAAEELASRV